MNGWCSTVTAFVEVAQKSARHYYDFLCKQENDEKKPGKKATEVSDIEKLEEKSQVFFLLKLKTSLVLWEAAKIEIDGVEYDTNKIQLVDYDEEWKILRIIAHTSELKMLLIGLLPQRIKVVSDLKFLVKRVNQWYGQYGEMLRIPDSTNLRRNTSEIQYGKDLSEQQKKAVKTALSVPFTYVWGAPGTGKTKKVLAQCLLYYIRRNERILITAPTNNAIEQILRGILPVLKENNIDLRRVLRMGLASRGFALEYPEVCENTQQAIILGRLNDEKAQILEELKRCEGQRQNFMLRHKWNEAHEKIEAFYEDAQKIANELMELFDKLSKLVDDELLSAEIEKKAIGDQEELRWEKSRLAARIRENEERQEKYGKGVRRFFRPKYFQQLKEEREELVKQSDACFIAEKRASEKIIESRSRQTEIKRCRELLLEQRRNNHAIIEKKSEIFSKNRPPLLEEKANKEDLIRYLVGLSGWRIDLSNAYERAMLKTKEEEGITEEYIHRWEEGIKTRLAKVEKEYSSAVENANLRNADVLLKAATIDTIIGRLNPKEPTDRPRHIFLDEAGYCSLIKGATLLAFGCPVTMLGDHMQLPPVCEMGDSEIKKEGNEEISLWAQSALYAETVFKKDILEVANDYIRNCDPPFEELERVELTHTFRYGQKLADILSEHVYGIDLKGASSYDTEIFFLDVNSIQEDNNRENVAEMKAIVDYCQKYIGEEIAILTPYTAQRKILSERLQGTAFEDCVMTVHASQGREWDTVLLSVVDTTNKWFTNSTNKASRGKQVINTAVSRARKKLVIVCDRRYWEKMTYQLIGQLIREAKPI